MEVSVVIPTLNEAALLPVLLEDLRQQTFDRPYEIIVADAGSSDRTQEIARDYGATVVAGGFPAIGRNNGAKAAGGAFLFFLDADVRVPATFLHDAFSEIDERYLDLATCEVMPLSDYPTDKLLHDFANFAVKLGQFSDPHAPGCCILVSHRLYRRAGGFNENLKLGEDHDFVKRASQFRPLRVLRSTQVTVSVRRLEKEGRVKLVNKYLAIELHRVFLGEIKNEIFEYEFGNFPNAEPEVAEVEFQESRRLMDKIFQSYSNLLMGLGGKQSFTNLPAERIAILKEQFEKLKELMGTMLTFPGKR
jgi:glycosyltransferase involved in cell wall biosynthesis